MNRTSKLVNIVLSALIALIVSLSTMPVVVARAVSSTAPDPALTRFVSPSGVDTGDCSDHLNPCLTINYAISQVSDGETIGVEEGVYSASGSQVVNLDGNFGAYTNLNLSGGWNSIFDMQSGYSTIDGQGARVGIKVSSVTVFIDMFIVTNCYSTGLMGVGV